MQEQEQDRLGRGTKPACMPSLPPGGSKMTLLVCLSILWIFHEYFDMFISVAVRCNKCTKHPECFGWIGL